TIVNRNTPLGTRFTTGGVIDGMKTGHTTAAGYSLVGSATRGGVTVVSAVLGEPSEAARDADTIKLLRWGSTIFGRRTLVREGDAVTQVAVEHGKAEAVGVDAGQALQRVVPRGEPVRLERTGVPSVLQAPIAAGTKVGSARVLVGGKLVGTIPLVTRTDVEKESLPAAVAGAVGSHWQGALVALLLILIGTLTLIRARSTRRPPRPRATAGAAHEPAERTTAP
ncbi:MAG: hypothetical protein PGN13_15185, partial [Patulibacter minatonensis]